MSKEKTIPGTGVVVSTPNDVPLADNGFTGGAPAAPTSEEMFSSAAAQPIAPGARAGAAPPSPSGAEVGPAGAEYWPPQKTTFGAQGKAPTAQATNLPEKIEHADMVSRADRYGFSWNKKP